MWLQPCNGSSCNSCRSARVNCMMCDEGNAQGGGDGGCGVGGGGVVGDGGGQEENNQNR